MASTTLKSSTLFETLNGDTLSLILQFVGRRSYIAFGGINKQCHEIYLKSGLTKETFSCGYAPLSVILDKYSGWDWDSGHRLGNAVGKGVNQYNRSDILNWALEEHHMCMMASICKVSVEEGRIDMVKKILSKVSDNTNTNNNIFGDLSRLAVRNGKLDMLKWLITNNGNEFPKDIAWCTREAARGGHLHILEWFKEKGHILLFNENVLLSAVRGNHLHILRWLREQGCSFGAHTFVYAAFSGNLKILEWLSDEGCPWDANDVYMKGYWVKPHVKIWLNDNGYFFDDIVQGRSTL